MNIGLYIRLSQADEEIDKIESDSITNQRMCLNKYLEQDKVLSKYNRLEFCDDGFSATNGNRPNFMKMMDMVQAGEIKTIIVRDFSRFFRDYIEAGNYLECVFPFLEVRFISINDNYDSDDYKGTTGGLEMAMRNIIYASYSKDLSVKVKTAMHHMMKQGKYVGSRPPYGYVMHKQEQHKLAIDETVAPIVKRIFMEAIDGKKISEIAYGLNEDNIPTRSQKYSENYPNDKGFNNQFNGRSFVSRWDYAKVHAILKNQVYIGTLVSGRKTRATIGSAKMIRQEPIIVEDTHEAIITKEEFEKANSIIMKINTSEKGELEYPLKMLVKCGDCRRAMKRKPREVKNTYFVCSNRAKDATSNCKTRKVDEKKIEQLAYNAILQAIQLLNTKLDTKAIKEFDVQDYIAKLSGLESQIESLKQYKIRLYENYIAGETNKEIFLKQKADTDKKITDIELEKEKLELEMQAQTEVSNTRDTNDAQSKYLMSAFSSSDKLTYEMAQAFIHAIYVYDEDNIEIEWKFKDIFVEGDNM
ncbi:MAG: recombinase family protein [Clostridia bacterium]